MNLHPFLHPAFLCLFVAAALAGCQSKPVSYAALLANPDGSTGKIVISGQQGSRTLDQPKTAAPLHGAQPPAPIGDEQLKKDFGAAMAARPLPPERFLLYFESGGAVLSAESAALLPQIIVAAAKRPGVDVSIIGHSDTVGKAEANAELALRRAQAIADQLMQQGLQATALTVESHGEANLLVKTPDETPEPRNRRVEVSIR